MAMLYLKNIRLGTELKVSYLMKEWRRREDKEEEAGGGGGGGDGDGDGDGDDDNDWESFFCR
jgi:hypothetical protein